MSLIYPDDKKKLVKTSKLTILEVYIYIYFFFPALTFFFAALPLLLLNLLLLSIEAALRRGDFPLFPPSGFNIHQELFPVPSF